MSRLRVLDQYRNASNTFNASWDLTGATVLLQVADEIPDTQ